MATYETKGRLTYKDENSDNHIIYPVTKMDCIEDMPDIEKEVAESVAAYLEENPVETPDITEQVERAEAAATAAEAAKESVNTSVNLADGYASSASSSATRAEEAATRAEEAATRAEEAVASIPESGGGTVKTVNGIEPDENGNVEITIPDSGGNVDLTGYVKTVNGQTPDAIGNVQIEVSGGNANIYAGATAPTDGSLVWIDTTEDTAEVEIDSTAWISGYRISGSGGLESIADNTANEAVNYAFIPVEPGETYTLYNSADETWASDTVYIGLYADCTGHSSDYLGRVTGTTFKVTNKTAFILISSANLANDENYLNARLVKGTEVTLTRISASYSGGDVEVGTDVSALTGIVVTAHYSDGTSATVTGYTLSGTIAEGNNVITVSYSDITTTFTVMGVSEETDVTLSSISATYSGGDVEEGTALSDLTGITVTATYSDGSTATVTDYTLSGEIAEGENIITVSYGGMTTSFTVTGIVDSGGSGSETVGITLTPDLWKVGYFNTGGGVTTSSSNGEMYYDEFIPVTPGGTYYFYNTAEDWTSTWLGFMWYTADKTSLGRKNPTIKNGYVCFTVSDETAFIKISSRNMTLYYETAVLQSYEDFPAPEMPFESTEWTDAYINDNGNVQQSTTNGNRTTGLVSVEAGATYRFANSNPDWNASHIGVSYYSDVLPTIVDHFTYKQAFTSYDFTVPEGTKYIRLSSQNLTEMYTTATLTKIS